MEISHNDDYVTIFVRNKLRVPAGIQIRFQSLRNLTPVPRLRKPNLAEKVVHPGAETQILTLVRNDSQRSASFPFRWKFSYGDTGAKHDDSYTYRMPFGGTQKRVVTQGANGSFTHNGTSAWAFDFGMPIGTPILAARAGMVVEMTDGYTKSGISESFLDKANAVTILHDDSTFATYAHLDPGSGVREGMRVKVGEMLGFSGNTGFSTGPHLHFSVWKSTWEGGHTIPIRFHDGRSGGFLPEEGIAYQPGCHADGIPCKPGELPAAPAGAAASNNFERQPDGICRCRNGALITTKLPCRAVCP
jgi:murein DD-endopeptidase MepM/ murein hydrolase activator NlpD